MGVLLKGSCCSIAMEMEAVLGNREVHRPRLSLCFNFSLTFIKDSDFSSIRSLPSCSPVSQGLSVDRTRQPFFDAEARTGWVVVSFKGAKPA